MGREMRVSAATGNISYEARKPSKTPSVDDTQRENYLDYCLQELVYASESGDLALMASATEELRMLYRKANQKG